MLMFFIMKPQNCGFSLLSIKSLPENFLIFWIYIACRRSWNRSKTRHGVLRVIRSFVCLSVTGSKFLVKVYKTSYFEDPLMDFIHIWHDGRYRM